MSVMSMMLFRKRSLVSATFVSAVLASICHGPQSQSTLLLESETGFPAEGANSDRERCCSFPAIFSFGSSVADTGTGVLLRVDYPASRYPYGVTFPGYPSGRWSDGRLLIDLWAEALGLPYLDPFIKSGTSCFLQGANFACAACTASEKYASSMPSTFTLDLQLYQFRRFKSQVLAAHRDRVQKSSRNQLAKDCESCLPRESVFREALYVVAVGANDLWYPIQKNTPIEEMEAAIPDISAAIMRVVEGLYEEGARNILVEDVYPLACLPIYSKVNCTTYGDTGAVDPGGCVKFIDDLVLMHNSLLKKEIVAFAQIHSPDLSIALVDTYSIRRELMTNPVKYGLKYGVATCCGVPDRFRSDEKCGESPLAQSCTDPSEYVVWDGLHFTEAANIATMKAILSGEHFYPKLTLSCTISCERGAGG